MGGFTGRARKSLDEQALHEESACSAGPFAIADAP